MPPNPEEYPPVADGTEHFPQAKGFELSCCDCGLTHTIDFRLYQRVGNDHMVEIPLDRYLISMTPRRLPCASSATSENATSASDTKEP